MSTTTATPETDLPAAAQVPAQPGAPEAESLPAEEAGPQEPAGGTPLLRQLLSWAGCVGCFVGAGLVGGGVVHRPLDPGRYTKVVLVGVVVFVLASLVNEVLLAPERPSRGRLLRLLGCSLLLSVGIGMLSGGIQHFSDARGWSETMIALGLVVSWLAYALRTGFGLKRTVVTTAAAAVLGWCVFAGLLHVPAPAPGSHGHAPAAELEGHAGAGHGAAGHAPAAPAPPAADVDLAEELARLSELAGQLEDLRVR